MTGQTLPVGGTWSGAGDATDFQINTTFKTTTRTSGATVRFGLAGTSVLDAAAVQVDVWNNADYANPQGLIARYVDTSNFVTMYVEEVSSYVGWSIYKSVAATSTLLASGTLPLLASSGDTVVSLRLVIDAAGRFKGYAGVGGAALVELVDGGDPDLATGGTLDDGKVGLWDEGGLATVRHYDNFGAWAISTDAAVFGSQSLEIRHDRAIREDSTGALWDTPSRYAGDYLLLPVTGAEGRTARVIVKAARSVPGSGPDSGIDDISARLYVTPRYLSVPEA